MTIWPILYFLHNKLIQTKSSGCHGAKQLEVLNIHKIYDDCFIKVSSSISKSVSRQSPTILFYIIIGIKLLVRILLKQLFWSILKKITYFLIWFILCNVNIHIDRAIPVANGKINVLPTLFKPIVFRVFFSSLCVIYYKIVLPGAFGWLSNKFPDLPIPWNIW